jgi:D-alanyl-D-alanine carboxypeptidase/Putative peptidoglycan binding domain
LASEAQLNPLFGPPCEHHDVVNVEVFGKTITFAQRGANQLLRAAIRAYDVKYAVYRIESYNCRKVTSGTSRSAHSWPVAVDINADSNPYSKAGNLQTDMPRAFVECFRAEGFGWGGDWTGAKDPMHFSLAPNERGKPRPERFDPRVQQQARAKWRQVHGGVTAGLAKKPKPKAAGSSAPPFPGNVLSYDRWRKTKTPDAGVRTFQGRLKERGWTIATDGNFTKQVETVVRAFQREKLLAVTGKVDAGTWNSIWAAVVT